MWLTDDAFSLLHCFVTAVFPHLFLLTTCTTAWRLRLLILCAIMSQGLANESQHETLMTHAMAPCEQLIIAAYGKPCFYLFLLFFRQSQRVTEALNDCSGCEAALCFGLSSA